VNFDWNLSLTNRLLHVTSLNWTADNCQSTTNSSQSELIYDWRFTANQLVLATSPLRLTAGNFIFQLNTCGYSPYVTSSLERGWVCRLQFLVALASSVILGSDSHEALGHILLSQIRGSPNLEGQVPLFISPRNRVARLYPQALGSLLVASYDSQDYGGGIRPSLRAFIQTALLKTSRHGEHRKHRYSVVIAQQYLDRYIQISLCLSASCIATAKLVARFEVSVQQRVYTPGDTEFTRLFRWILIEFNLFCFCWIMGTDEN
jgi:hypothetical protein